MERSKNPPEDKKSETRKRSSANDECSPRKKRQCTESSTLDDSGVSNEETEQILSEYDQSMQSLTDSGYVNEDTGWAIAEDRRRETYSFSTQMREDIPLIYSPNGCQSSLQFKNYLLDWINKIIETQETIKDFKESWTDGKHFITLINKIKPKIGNVDEIIEDRVKQLKKCFNDMQRHTGIAPPVCLENELEKMIVDKIAPKEENIFRFLAEILLFTKSCKREAGKVIREFQKDSYYTEVFESIPLTKVEWKSSENFGGKSKYISQYISLTNQCSIGDCLKFKHSIEKEDMFYGIYIGATSGSRRNGFEIIFKSTTEGRIKKKGIKQLFENGYKVKIYNVIDDLKHPLRAFKILERANRGYKKASNFINNLSTYDFVTWCRNDHGHTEYRKYKQLKSIKESANLHFHKPTEVKNFMDQVSLGDWLEHARMLKYSHMSIYVGPWKETQSQEETISFEPYIIENFPTIFSNTNLNAAPLKRAWGEIVPSILNMVNMVNNKKTIKINNNHDDNPLKPLPTTFIRNNALMAYFKENIEGNMNYNLFLNNCEHFATGCRYGQPSFTQSCPIPNVLQTFLEKHYNNRNQRVLKAFGDLSEATHDQEEKQYILDLKTVMEKYEEKSKTLEMNEELLKKCREEVIDQIEQDIANITGVIDSKWNGPRYKEVTPKEMLYLQQKIEEHFQFYRLMNILLNQIL